MQSQRSKGLTNVLAIGTALPPVCVPHDTYPDKYFRLTNSEHLTELKEKMTRICKLIASFFFSLFSFLVLVNLLDLIFDYPYRSKSSMQGYTAKISVTII